MLTKTIHHTQNDVVICKFFNNDQTPIGFQVIIKDTDIKRMNHNEKTNGQMCVQKLQKHAKFQEKKSRCSILSKA